MNENSFWYCRNRVGQQLITGRWTVGEHSVTVVREVVAFFFTIFLTFYRKIKQNLKSARDNFSEYLQVETNSKLLEFIDESILHSENRKLSYGDRNLFVTDKEFNEIYNKMKKNGEVEL